MKKISSIPQTHYALDNSAIIHLAVIRKRYTNTFRLTATLTESVQSEILQRAVDNVTPQFPTIVAGIRRSLFQYEIVSSQVPPTVQQQAEILGPMTRAEIAYCAIRVLYCDRQISIECFHALTDGYGGRVFLNALLVEYFRLLQTGKSCFTEPIPKCEIDPAEWNDDFLTYAGEKSCAANHRRVYRLPQAGTSNGIVHVTTGVCHEQKLLDTAHSFDVSATVFLTAVMFEAIMKLQGNHVRDNRIKKPIQIMIPINLRKRFASKTVRNFSLYALPCLTQTCPPMSFRTIVEKVAKQMQEQTSITHLSAMMATNVRTQNLIGFQILPLPIKDFVLRIIYHFYGKRNSCLSISNLGEISCPEMMQGNIQKFDFLLTPRSDAPYNCGIVSYENQLTINFTRKCEKMELEPIFFQCLRAKGCTVSIISDESC